MRGKMIGISYRLRAWVSDEIVKKSIRNWD